MNGIAAWLEKHKLSTHTIGVIVAGIIASYQLNPGFHDLVINVEAKLPGWVMTLLIEGAWLYAWYRNGEKAPAQGGGSSGLGAVLGHTLTVFVLCALVAIPGCATKVNSKNPAVVQAVTLLDAENTVNSIAHGLQAANGTLAKLASIEPYYYAYAHPKLVQIAQLNEKANAAILAAKNGNTTVDWKSALIAVSQVVTDPTSLTTFGFKNPSSQQQVQEGFGVLLSGIALAASFGGQ